VSGSSLYASVCRRLADDPRLAEVVPADRWDVPVRLLAALHYLALTEGIDPWRDPSAIIAERRGSIRRFVAEQKVQTNEVQRTWALLPAFLSLGASPLELLELGPSAGLNLVWDRYRFRYAAGSWGPPDSALELHGEEREPVPSELLQRSPEVVRRRGVDLDPVDVTGEDGALLLRSFVWADQHDRIERLDRAIEALRADPPELVRGDYVELLPDLLDDRAEDALLVVFQTVSTSYLSRERYVELRRHLARAARPLAWISTRAHFEEETDLQGGFELELALWPRRRPALVARIGYHGQWLEWLG
jgi:hypothetical protein